MSSNKGPEFVKGCIEIRKKSEFELIDKLKKLLKSNKLPYKFHPGSFCTNN